MEKHDLRISVSGIRGILGSGLTPEIVQRYILAFGNWLPAGPVLVARDARPTGAMVARLVTGCLQFTGHDVVDLGIVPTPTVGLAISQYEAAGAVIVTASHNPVEWNALKLLSGTGFFLSPQQFAEVEGRLECHASGVRWDTCGSYAMRSDAVTHHIEKILANVNSEIIAGRSLAVAVDGCASAGGPALTALLNELGCKVIPVDCEPNGHFTRGLEPVTENLTHLGRVVRESHAAIGVAVDPDADRVAFVDEAGNAIGEELSLALAAEHILCKHRSPRTCLVTNLSSSMILDDIAACHQARVVRTRIGEAHVVAQMLKEQATIGGEGNGGVIYPPVHLGRDSLTGSALLLELMATREQSLKSIVAQLPHYCMIKASVPQVTAFTPAHWDTLEATLQPRKIDTIDGYKYCLDDAWVHVRASNTEPIIRVIAESKSEQRTRELIDTVRSALLREA